MDKSVINVWPIVLDPSDFSLLLNPDADSDFFFSDGLGGGIASDVTIRTQAQPYLVERSIFVLYVKSSILPSRLEFETCLLIATAYSSSNMRALGLPICRQTRCKTYYWYRK